MEANLERSTITDYLSADHREIDELWAECIRAIDGCDLARVRKGLETFAARLTRHIRLEEELLFPAFEERTGMRQAGPTAVMRAEHREMEAILERLSHASRLGDCVTIKTALKSEPLNPSALFESHNAKEERILYPMADQALPAEQREAMLSTMRAQQ